MKVKILLAHAVSLLLVSGMVAVADSGNEESNNVEEAPTLAPLADWAENRSVYPTAAPSITPSFSANSSMSPSQAVICGDVVQKGFIVDNLSWGKPNHTGSDSIDRSINPQDLTKRILADSSLDGYGLLVDDGAGTYAYKYNFTKLGTSITLNYLLNEERSRDFMIYAVGIHCIHNDTFLLGDIVRYEFGLDNNQARKTMNVNNSVLFILISSMILSWIHFTSKV